MVYVDELRPPAERGQELAEILRSVAQKREKWESLMVFGTNREDMNDYAKDMAAVLSERGTEVLFHSEMPDI